MSYSGRSRRDSRSRSPEITRKKLELLPEKGLTHEALPWSPTSPTNFLSHEARTNNPSRPKTPEEWLDFAHNTIWGTTRVVDAIRILAAEPDLLEFLMTENKDVRDSVYELACGVSFPTKRELWHTSIGCYFLQRFQVYLVRLPPDLANRNIDEASRHASALVGALSALDHVTIEDGDAHEEDELEDTFFKIKSKKSQKQRKVNKASRARSKTTLVDPRLFMTIDMDVPVTADEVMVTEIRILEQIQGLLKVLLTAFDNPNLAPHAKALFFQEPLQYTRAKSTPNIDTTAEADAALNTGPEVGAYPHIRPLAAAKYFDEGTGLGAWNIIVSGRAIKDLRHMQKEGGHVFGMVYKKIMELSQGFFSDDNQKRLIGSDTEVPIYEAKVSRDLRIVYQIDLDTDVDAKIDKQIIKLYGVYTHAQLDNRLWASVSHYHINRRGREYRRRCLHRETPRARGQNVTLPAHFKHEEDMEAQVEPSSPNDTSLNGMTEQDFLDLHSLIALEKFIPMSQSLITSILNNSDANHVFHVSAKEKEIIYHESACFVLGRSGTGKTTSILFKMIGIEKLFEQMEEITKPRQVFVTQSRVLAQRVQEYYRSLVKNSSEAANKESQDGEQEEEVLADLDDEDASTFGLPAKYSMLEDKHFPLFVTYDQLCSLLEADFGLQFRRTPRTKVQAAAEKRFAIAEIADVKIDLDKEAEFVIEPAITEVPSPVDTKEDIQQARRAAVTFEIFVAAYWPHFDFRLTKGLDPALIYSEFLGIIEGSEAALQSPTGALSRDEYTSLSHRKSSFASQKNRVYDLYELYRKRKQFLGGYDSAERTHALVTALILGVPGPKIDCLYVDEAQDNLLIDTKLLHTLSNNPHGIFMAGDTAQTISAGSAFRFEDLKAFLWRLEEQDEAVRCGKRQAIHPALFHLAVNYRSHGGIVDCASSVVQLISDLFPYSIDKLSRETGLIDGPKPLFFSGWDHNVVRFEQFLQGEADTRIDFGASQVILVRNEAARAALRAQVGEIGLILTLYESKGLEFDDVLLYNFFEDSVPSASTWRVILHGHEGAHLGPVPRFDEIRHAVICTELKNLYVGLTRARNHCWIWDVSDKAEPMKLFWKKKDLISLCGPDDTMPQLGASSSEADWAKSGRLLFNKGLYPQAMFCFEKAGLLVERDIAGAYQARKDARLLLAKSTDRQTRRGAFKKAADDFLGCAFLSKGKQQISCYLRAAECFIQAEDWKPAAESYLSAEQFDLSAKNFRRAGCFDEAVQIVRKYRNQLKSQGLVDEILAIARLEFLRKSEYQKAAELFDDVDEQLEYMEDFGFNSARIHVLKLHKRFSDAAAVALQEQNTLEAVKLLLMSDERAHQVQAINHAIHGLWTLLPYGAPITTSNQNNVGTLIEATSAINSQLINDNERRQLELFQVVHARKQERILSLSRSNALLSRASEALLGFAHCSKYLTTLQNLGLDDFNHKSELALSYYNGLIQLSRSFQTSSSETQRLLGFEPLPDESTTDLESKGNNTDSNEFWIYSSSCLYEPARRALGNPEPIGLALKLEAVIVSGTDLPRLISGTLTGLLKRDVGTMSSTAIPIRILRPCLEFAVLGNCNRPNCGRQEISSLGLTDSERQKHFNSRLRAHILQGLIIQAYPEQNRDDGKFRRNNIRIWVEKLYETLFPYFPPMGNILCVDRRLVPELDRAATTFSRWCEIRLYDLNPAIYDTQQFFIAGMLSSLELGSRIERNIFESYVSKLHSCRLVHAEALLISPFSNRSIVHDYIDYYGEQTENTLHGVVIATRHIVDRSLSVEINVLIHLLESIGRDIIMQARAFLFAHPPGSHQTQEGWASARTKALDGLLVPRSWAVEIIRRPPKRPQAGWDILPYLNTLYEVLRLLKFEDSDHTPFYTFSGNGLGIVLRGVMSIRICRLLILVANNAHYPEKERIRSSIKHSLSLAGGGFVHDRLCSRYNKSSSWRDLETALYEGPLNRGTEELVRLLSRDSRYRPPKIPGVRLVVYETVVPGLEQDLAFVISDIAQRPALNPEAKPFAPGQIKGLEGAQPILDDLKKEESHSLEKDDPFGGLVPPQLMFKAPASTHRVARILTDDERTAALIILRLYRDYSRRWQNRIQDAIHIIWAYYTRYRRRCQAKSENNQETVRKLHEEYKKTVDEIDHPFLLEKMFRTHQMILQGPMAHVLIYLRGLERINQRQKESTKKRLQKVQHEELEKVQVRMTICNDFNKRLRKLYPIIQPGSKFLRDLHELKRKVGEVDALRVAIVEAFGENCISANLENHYFLGIRVILTPSPQPTAPKAPRPELNTTDLEVM
ncbi:hypothetical protein B0J17DRAFT_405653 [Rhizoctonia solani]|nr:hypothetical protein B0J17DRAFT_405653 [Rhizoctonia solani]